MKKTSVAVVGATGIVGQRLVSLLFSHPFFELTALCAGPSSCGKEYGEAIGSKNCLGLLPEELSSMRVLPPDPKLLSEMCELVFCAVKLPFEQVRALEEAFAKRELAVFSLNSANRLLEDVPMVIPEINPEHLSVIPAQRKRLKTSRGFIVTKCNCATSAYVPLLTPLLPLGLEELSVTTLQAASGAGKKLSDFPNLKGNILPHIEGEEKKCKAEPLKLWGEAREGKIFPIRKSDLPIRAQCFRVPVEDGHFACVFAKFKKNPEKEEIFARWENFNESARLPLPSAPEKFLRYFTEESRPQPLFDLYADRGMSIEAGRVESSGKGVKFVGLVHNTLRGAAGGAVLLAELLKAQGYLI